MSNLLKPWYKRWWGILLITLLLLLFSLLFAAFFYVVSIVKTTLNNTNGVTIKKTIKPELMQKIIGTDYYWLGTDEPEITIVEFSDFSCLYCKKSFPTIRELSLRYQDKIKYIFRDFPVTSEQSADLAMAARCAGEQGLFWVLHDKLFINQGITTKEEILNLAEQSGTDIDRFVRCMDLKKYATEIEKDFNDGEELGVSGTPTWFINGIMIEGSIPDNIFISIIENILKNN
ncbi:thioredoxin domain-containing protein [bacterium]|nr:thioredoxin domain-containing protein [bacterium]